MLQVQMLILVTALVFENSRLSPESYQWVNVVVMLHLISHGEEIVVIM